MGKNMTQEEMNEFDARAFSEALDEFFETCFDKAEKGEMSYEQIERFIGIAKDRKEA